MFRDEILRGIDFLSSVQNSDGGIPGIKATGASACWTTAEALETALLSPYLKFEYYDFVFRMINFILSSQNKNIEDNQNYGSWPEFLTTQIGQTMTTGHALAALRLASRIIVDDDSMTQSIENAIQRGFNYLNRTQNSDGGWGLEPAGTGEAKDSKAFNTIFVLRGYIANGYNFGSSRAVQRGIAFLKTHKDIKSGGFSQKVDADADVCYTARIISTLISSKAYLPKDKYIKSALKFIYRDRTLKELFKIKNEAYVSETSAGLVVFHSNTPIDVMEALCLCKYYDRRVRSIENWIIKTQEDNGGWFLAGTESEGVITWTTNEAVFALICADKAFKVKRYPKLERMNKLLTKVTLSFAILLLLMLLFPINLTHNGIIAELWAIVPETIQQYIYVTVIGGIVLNISSNFIYDTIKKIKERRGHDL